MLHIDLKRMEPSSRNGPFQLLDKPAGRPSSSKITATSLLLGRDGTVILGTAEGQVILAQQGSTDSIITALKSKKPVTRLGQLLSDPSTTFALCSGELFSLHSSTLNRRPPFQNLRGVVDFVVNDLSESLTGIALCVVTVSPTNPEDGSLHLFSSRLEKLKEIPLRGAVGTPTQACWCSTNMICVGGTSSATLVDSKGLLRKIPIIVDAKRGPVMLRLPNDRVLLSSAGGLGVVIDMQGFPCPNVGAIVWSSSPVALVACGPYVVALSEEGLVEIALMDSPGSIIQTITVTNGSHALAADIGYNGETPSVVSTDTHRRPAFSFVMGLANQYSDCPFRLVAALPLEDQITELLRADAADCTRAMALIKESFPLIGNENEERRMRQAEEFMYLKAAAILLETKSDFERAFALLSIADIDALQLLSFGGYISSQRKVEGSNEDMVRRVIVELELFKEDAFRSQVLSHANRVRQASRNQISGRDLEELDTAMLMFLVDDVSSKGTNEVEAFCSDFSNRLDVDKCSQVLESKGLLLAAAHLKATQTSSLRSAMEAYKQLNEPHFVRQVILRMAQEEQADESQDLSTVFKDNLEWIIQHASADDLKQVLGTLAPIVYIDDPIPENEILDACQKAKKNNGRRLIAMMALAKQDKNQFVSATRMVQVLISAIEESMDAGEPKESMISSRLNELINGVGSTQTAAETALQMLSQSKYKSRFGKERANCLGALGQHREALRILVNELNDFEGAERYCETRASSIARMGPTTEPEADRAASAQVDPFAILLALHMERFTEQSVGPRADAAIAFLSKHASRVNPLEAIQALPETLPLTHAMKFLEPAIIKTTHSRREMNVEKNLAKTENLQAKVELVMLERKWFVVDELTICQTCGLRIGSAQAEIIHDALGPLGEGEKQELLQSRTGKRDSSTSTLRKSLSSTPPPPIRHLQCPTIHVSGRNIPSVEVSLGRQDIFKEDDPSDWKQLQ